MRIRAAAVAVTVFAAVGVIAGVANATSNSKVDLFYDGVPGSAEIDMAGPTGFGFVNYNKNADGALRFVVSLKNAAPNTTFSIYYVCGPTHALICAPAYLLGTFTTDADGNANSGALWLENPPFVGAPDDHVDIVGGNQGFAATPIVNE